MKKLRQLWASFRQEMDFWRRVWRHPKTPRVARWLLGLALVYAVTPIDLIPDFIPILGHLDDVIIIPLIILVARSLVPKAVLLECRQKADAIEVRAS